MRPDLVWVGGMNGKRSVICGEMPAAELRCLARREPDRAAARMQAIAGALEGLTRAEAARLAGRGGVWLVGLDPGRLVPRGGGALGCALPRGSHVQAGARFGPVAAESPALTAQGGPGSAGGMGKRGLQSELDQVHAAHPSQRLTSVPR